MKKNKLQEALKAENVRYGKSMLALDNREDLYCDRHEFAQEGTASLPVVGTKPPRRDLQTDMHMLKMEHEVRKIGIRQKHLTDEL